MYETVKHLLYTQYVKVIQRVKKCYGFFFLLKKTPLEL